MKPVLSIIAAVLLPLSAQAGERVGKSVLINTSVTGNGSSLATGSPVHKDDRIVSSSTGLGEFVFRDGTKLAVGPGSSVVIDKFVFNDAFTAKSLSIKASKGTFRWISGGSKSSAYKIDTPVGTLAVRGTAFDFYVGQNGITAIVLLNGRAQFCGRNGCEDLKRRCDVVIATRSGVSKAKRADPRLLNELGNRAALPFQTGDQELSRKLRVRGSNCLSVASLNVPSDRNIRGVSPNGTNNSGPGGTGGTGGSSGGTGGEGGDRGNRRGDNGRGNGGGDGSPNGRGDSDR